MRQIVSSGSVKAFLINNDEVISIAKKVSTEAKQKFPEIKEIWLFGSLAKGEASGLSDIDLLVVAETTISNPVDRVKTYYPFFADCLKIACDVIVITPKEKHLYTDLLNESILLA